MSETQAVPSSEKGRQRQKGSKILFKLLNPMMKLILNSPFHQGMSKRVMVLSFTGRKTAKRYSTPVSYVWDGDHVIVVTFSPWWKNFKEPAPVQMRIQGKSVSGTAVFVRDPVRIKQIVRTLMNSSGKEMMQRMGLWIEAERAASLAWTISSTIEGAVIPSRTFHNVNPLVEAGKQLISLIRRGQ